MTKGIVVGRAVVVGVAAAVGAAAVAEGVTVVGGGAVMGGRCFRGGSCCSGGSCGDGFCHGVMTFQGSWREKAHGESEALPIIHQCHYKGLFSSTLSTFST